MTDEEQVAVREYAKKVEGNPSEYNVRMVVDPLARWVRYTSSKLFPAFSSVIG